MLTGSKRPTDATAVTGAPVDIRGAERTRGVPGDDVPGIRRPGHPLGGRLTTEPMHSLHLVCLPVG
jgi:hypothetical protein